MFDFNLQTRFMKCALDAWLGYAAAGAAAWDVWQQQATSGLKSSEPAQLAFFDFERANPFMWWASLLTPGTGRSRAPTADFGAPFFQFAPAMQFPMAFMSPASAPWMNGWTETLQSCSWAWPQASWSLYQFPMTAMLVSAGVPYAVAEPAARANVATMDAADAAHQTFNKFYSSFQTNGGHALQPWQAFMAMIMLPFMAPLSQFGSTGRLL